MLGLLAHDEIMVGAKSGLVDMGTKPLRSEQIPYFSPDKSEAA